MDIVYDARPESLVFDTEYPERHKKSKKKKKKKDRGKKHKHHKEKRRGHFENESSQGDFSINEDSTVFQNNSTLSYAQMREQVNHFSCDPIHRHKPHWKQ